VVELVQVTVLVAIAVGLGWSMADLSWWRLALALLLGTAAFAGIGLCLAGRLRAEANLAAQNGLYLVLLALGGVIVPVDDLPDSLGAVARYLPSGALAEVMHASLGFVLTAELIIRATARVPLALDQIRVSHRQR
jgi:ABC-2 type transport system permease protein